MDDGLIWTAHELRGPIVAVRAALDHLVSVDGDGLRSSTDLLRRTRDELDGMLEIVDPLLRCAAGIPGPFSDVDLGTVAEEVVTSEVRRSPAARRRLRISARSFVFVHADASLLKVAMSNLVRNALIHSSDAEPVTISVESREGVAMARIEDRGPGVPASERELIFEGGRRGRLGLERPGYGLGLFIARRIVEAHGGRLWLEQTPAGADFRMELMSCEGREASCAS